MISNKQNASLMLLILMASITFLAILSELMPSGVLPLMSDYFRVGKASAGSLVGFYAIASALCGIPLVSWTVEWNRKKLLAILLIGFALSNVTVSLSPFFPLALAGRVLGGMCAGTLWPMITAYGMALVDKENEGRAIAIIMSGTTIGISIGQPIMTGIGLTFGFKVEFLSIGLFALCIAILCSLFLPSVPGEKRSQANSPLTMLKNSGVQLVLLLTFLGVAANYGLYTFITNLVADISYSGISSAQIFFGVGSIISVGLAMRYLDHRLHLLVSGMFGTGLVTMFLFYLGSSLLLFHLAFLLWGVAFGSLSSLFQSSTARQVTEGTAVANALQSSSFNFSIMIGSTVSGLLLEQGGTSPIIIMSAGLFLLGGVISSLSKKFFV